MPEAEPGRWRRESGYIIEIMEIDFGGGTC